MRSVKILIRLPECAGWCLFPKLYFLIVWLKWSSVHVFFSQRHNAPFLHVSRNIKHPIAGFCHWPLPPGLRSDVQVTRECFTLDPCSCWCSSLSTGIQGKTFAINLHFWMQSCCSITSALISLYLCYAQSEFTNKNKMMAMFLSPRLLIYLHNNWIMKTSCFITSVWQ